MKNLLKKVIFSILAVTLLSPVHADKLDKIIEKLEEINNEHHYLAEALEEKYQHMFFQHIIFNTLDHLELLKHYSEKNYNHKKELIANIEHTKKFLSKLNSNSDLSELLNEFHYLDFITQNLRISLQNYAGSLAKMKRVQESLIFLFECKPQANYWLGIPLHTFVSENFNPLRMVANPIARIDDEGSYAWNPWERPFQYDHWYQSAIHLYLAPVSTFVDFILFQGEENKKRRQARGLMNAAIVKNNVMYEQMAQQKVISNEFIAVCNDYKKYFNANDSILSDLKNILGTDNNSFNELKDEVDDILIMYEKSRENISNYQDMVNRSLEIAGKAYGIMLMDLENRTDAIDDLAFNRTALESENIILNQSVQNIDKSLDTLLRNVEAHDQVNSFRGDFSEILFIFNDMFEDALREGME